MKHIWIINEYAGNNKYGGESRHYEIAKELTKKNYNITIISASYSHLFTKFPKNRKEENEGVNFFWIKVFNYGDAHNKKRVWKWFLFTLKIFFLPFYLKKPDVIIVSPLAPFSILPAWALAKIYGAKLIFEVKDIWPLSLVEVGGFGYNHPFIKFMRFFEKFALNKSDIIVSNLSNYGEYLKNIGIEKKFVWISNGINTDIIKNNNIQLPNKIENFLKINKFVVGYIGTFSKSNAIDLFLENIKLVSKDIDIKFLFVGTGELREEIEKYRKIDRRIVLFDRVEKKVAFQIMKKCNVLFKGNPNNKLYQYGISPIKIFEYMLAGKPILHSTNVINDIVKIANCGISVEAENPQAVANGILKFYNMSESQRKILGKNGKNYVLNCFTYEKLAKKYEQVFKGVMYV